MCCSEDFLVKFFCVAIDNTFLWQGRIGNWAVLTLSHFPNSTLRILCLAISITKLIFEAQRHHFTTDVHMFPKAGSLSIHESGFYKASKSITNFLCSTPDH